MLRVTNSLPGSPRQAPWLSLPRKRESLSRDTPLLLSPRKRESLFRGERGRFFRLGAICAAIAQLAILVVPFAEPPAAQLSRAVFDVQAPQQQPAHDETICPACTAQHLLGRPASARIAMPSAEHAFNPAETLTAAPVTAPTGLSHPPRAPPTT